MTDQTVMEPPAKPRRKYVRRAAPKVEKPSPYEGMTELGCATLCKPERCVISGTSYCAHPRKGGLQSRDIGNQAALHRLQEAKARLAHMMVDKRK